MAITFEEVSFHYGEKAILQNVSFTLPDHGCICLFGPSGCGKTTLLRLLAGLEQPCSGQIQGLQNHSVAAVFQEDRLLPWRSVLDNVRLAGDTISTDHAVQLLTRMGLSDVAYAYPGELSGGMNRRVAIARALAVSADLLLLDEPFNGLDATRAADIAAVVRQVYANKPIVMVSHSREETAWMNAQLCELPDTPPLFGRIF